MIGYLFLSSFFLYIHIRVLGIKERHDKIGHYTHWKICKYYWILDYKKWYKHQPKPITEAKRIIIL